jgi:DNA/RNA endonuclease YhcR with UshA esterase domain
MPKAEQVYHDQVLLCCGLGGISSLWNVNKTSLKRAEKEARAAHRSYVIAATINLQTKATALLPASGYKVLGTFLNRNTHNVVTIWGKKI